MASANIKLGYKTAAWFTANATLVLKVGQIVYLEQTGTYKLGDGVTQLSALSFLGGNGLAYTPEDVANKSTSVNTDQASNTKYPSVKAVYDWTIALFLKKGTITNNTILKGSGTDTATDSNITDDGTLITLGTDVKINGSIKSPDSLSSIYNFDSITGYEHQGATTFGEVNTNDTRTRVSHDVLIELAAPTINTQLTASKSVETDANKNLVSVTHYTESFAYTGSPFNLTVAPNYIFSIRTTSMVLDESDVNDVTIVGTTLTVINPAFQAGETLYIKYKG